MKLIICLILALLVSLNALKEYSNSHILILKDDESTINGIELIEEPIFGVSFKEGVVRIIEEGTYIVSGVLKGKLHISTGDKVVKIILNGVYINSTINSLVFEDGYELIDTVIDNDPYVIRQYDFNNAGAQIIIADDSVNKLYGTEDGKKNGAIFSNVTLHITGEEKGNGKLYVSSLKEGIEIYKHLCISGGYVNVAADDDGINSKTNKDSVIYIKGGKVLVNSGLGDKGDGIDGNGYIIVDGGEVISAAQPNADSGLDSNFGIFVNGGIVYAVGANMDMAEEESEQPTMNLIFEESVGETSCISIKDKNTGSEIIRYNANEEEFINGTTRRSYLAAIVSHPSFKKDNVYQVYMNGELLGYTSNERQGPMPGPPGPGPRPDPPGPGPNPPGPPPNSNKLKETENNKINVDFVLSSGAKFFSGIKKYNSGSNLKFGKSLFVLFFILIL